MEKIKTILVDDHKIIRDGLKALLFKQKRIIVVGEAYDAEELFALLQEKQPDVVIIDIELPTLSGIEISRILENDFPEIKKIILSANITEGIIPELIEYGVLGILSKSCSADDFINSIEKAYDGQHFYNDYVANLILKSFINKNNIPSKFNKPQAVEISEREVEVIKCFAEGMIYKEIADMLNISIRTVESHKVNILRKLKLNTVIDIVKYAIKNNIVSI